MSTAKYRRELLRRLPPGYRFRGTPGKHDVLVDPDGEVVRGPDGRPILGAGSPGDARALRNDLSLIRSAGVPVT